MIFNVRRSRFFQKNKLENVLDKKTIKKLRHFTEYRGGGEQIQSRLLDSLAYIKYIPEIWHSEIYLGNLGNLRIYYSLRNIEYINIILADTDPLSKSLEAFHYI